MGFLLAGCMQKLQQSKASSGATEARRGIQSIGDQPVVVRKTSGRAPDLGRELQKQICQAIGLPQLYRAACNMSSAFDAQFQNNGDVRPCHSSSEAEIIEI